MLGGGPSPRYVILVMGVIAMLRVSAVITLDCAISNFIDSFVEEEIDDESPRELFSRGSSVLCHVTRVRSLAWIIYCQIVSLKHHGTIQNVLDFL